MSSDLNFFRNIILICYIPFKIFTVFHIFKGFIAGLYLLHTLPVVQRTIYTLMMAHYAETNWNNKQ
jgi:hypothetical protein